MFPNDFIAISYKMSSTGKRARDSDEAVRAVKLEPMPVGHEVVPGTGETKPIPSAPMGQGRRRRTQKKRKMHKRKTHHRRR